MDNSNLLFAQGFEIRKITGKVLDNKIGVANVTVTDGINCVKTDNAGCYSIVTPIESRFIYISVPSNYRVPIENNTVVKFYQSLEKDKNQYDFELQRKSKNDVKHAFIVQADAQVTSESDLKQYKSIVADCKSTIKSLDGVDVFGLDCGDIVGDTPELFPAYIKTISPLDIPIRRVIGNHDMDKWGRSFETSYKTYQDFFGPDHYSFNVGKAHYIVINDNFYIGRDYFYMGYITESTFKWMEQDLETVPKGSLLFVIMHIPSQLTKEKQPFAYEYGPIADQMVNAPAFHEFLKGYDTHIISGHMHYNLNINFRDNLMEHNTASACGTWWQVPVCLDGTPRGYAVYEVDGDIVKWYYKGEGYKRDYQMHVYGVGKSNEYPNDVIANVWNYDNKWKVELIENGKAIKMEKYTGYDPYAYKLCSDKSKIHYDWISPIKNEHMFRATPKDVNSNLQVRVTDRFGEVYIQDVK